ncbi:MAG: histidine kinase dimerization/phospho-acceptor domain-containing protein, partial [Planctomycetota bacterium]
GERAAKQRLVDLLSVQLENADRQIESVFDAYGASLKKQLLGVDGERLAPADVVQQLRAMRWKLPIVRQGLFIDQEGRLLHPGPEDLSQFESTEILTALPGIIDARPELEVPARRSQSTQTASSDEPTRSRRFAVASRSSNLKETASSGAWQQWYLADGAQVIFWLGRDDGTAIGILMERSRWMADVIANLPDQVIDASTSPAGLPLGRVKLVDESNRLIYQWGNAEGSERTTLSERHVAMPLASWRMVLDIDPKLVPQSSVIPIYASLAAVAIVVLAVGGYAVSAVRRQIAEASRRVSFAGQVSHELRTPLTNIRLYTELAEQDVQRLGE